MINLRAELIELQKVFDEAISPEESNNNLDMKYSKISNIINSIQNILEPFLHHQQIYDNTVFLIGPTGVGKSTLLNYITGKDLYFRTYNDKPGIFPMDGEGIAYVGQGEGSTTIVPNIFRASTGDFQNISFIDCAGDFDSNGIIPEIINSKIKSIIAQNVKNAKILMVTSQDSISPSGSYGIIFKNGLEKSAQFLSDINYFKDSIGLIVSHAGRISNTNKTIESYLKSVSNNPQILKYKPAIENLIQHNRIATFSKYSDEIEENNLYTPPTWNLDQRNKIIDLIRNMTFKSIPKGLFNYSSSVEVREQMSIAFEIVKTKAASLLQFSVEQALHDKLIIRATELKHFVNFVEEKVCHKQNTSLTDYFNHLNYHNFLKLLISEGIKKLSQELEFLASFTKPNNQTQQVKENWGTLIDANSLFKNILDETKIIIHEADELFSSFVEKTKIVTIGCFGENSKNIKTLFAELFNAYKNKANIESNKNNDKYYFYDTEKKFIGFKSESYTEEQLYSDKEPYTETVPYEDVEHYTRKMWVNTQTGQKLGYRNEYKHELEHDPDRKSVFVIKLIRGEIKLQDVPHTRPIIKSKEVTKERDVIKVRTVTKNKEVPEYKDVKVKKFDETKYNEDINNANTTINNLKLNISEILSQLKAINITKKCNISLDLSDKIENEAKALCFTNLGKYDEIKANFSFLTDEWKYLEYEAQELSEYESQIIGGNL